jgi:ATP-binding cassette subfamily B protein
MTDLKARAGLRSTDGQRPSRLRAAVKFALPQRKPILVTACLVILGASLSAIEPLILRSVVDGLAGEDGYHSLIVGLGGLTAAALVREGVSSASNWLIWRTRIGLQFNLLEATIGKLQSMPLHVQRSEGVGAIMTRLDRSIQGFTEAISQIAFNVLPAFVFLTSAIWIMLRLDWRLAALVLVFAPLPALVAVRAGPFQASRERTLMDRWARIYSRFNEVLSGIVTVRSFGMEEAEKRRFLNDVADANRIVVRGVAVDCGFGATSNLIIAVARLSAIGGGGLLVLRGEISVGTLFAFLGYVGGVFGPVQGLSGIYQSVSRASASFDQILGIVGFEEQLADAADARDIEVVDGTVNFEDVHFRYGAAGRPLINGLSFSAKAGETVAIVGPSGSGKTTLMALLMRFYDPLSGTIRIDGRDLATIRQSAIRRSIGVVLQDPLLFNDTVRANIAYGKPSASPAEIEAAARAANAHDFIQRLPEGYDSGVGERGGLLSVGERQRITIARALLKNPRILMLDEATSALDAESEVLVGKAVRRLMEGRTTFIIAHRLSTVVDADRILVLKDGRLIESGSHCELMRLNGYYASLVARQQLGFAEPDLPAAA